MKKLLYSLILLGVFASCKKDGPETEPINITVQLAYVNDHYNTVLADEPITITLKNLSTGTIVTKKSSNGAIEFADVNPGNYDVDASIEVDKVRFEQLTGETIDSEAVTFNATAKNTSFTAHTTLDLYLVNGVVGDFVIKQIYYAGSDRSNGALYRDQFIEIYNNTDRTLYADSLYFGRLWGKQTPSNTTHYFQENGQLDWTKSLGMNNPNANTDYVYVRDMFMIPGSGKDYPIAPGASIVIAQNAINHKVPYTDGDGEEQPIRNPELTVDLSKADFEVFYGDIPGVNPLASDVNNPAVPNVEVIKPQGRDWLLDNLGRDSYFLFKGKSRSEVDALASYHAPLINPPSETADKYIQLPNTWINDAVEVQPNIPTSRIPKKLNFALDAGFTFVSEGGYSSQAVIRKTLRKVGDRRILKDSNNSTEDFMVIKANPRGFGD